MKTLHYTPRSIYVTLSVIMIALVVLLYLALASYQLRAGKQRMLRVAADTFERVGREAVAAIEGELRPARTTAALLADTALLTAPDQPSRLAQLPLLAGALSANPSLSAVYGGSENGSFLLLRRLDSPALRELMKSPDRAAFVLQSVNRDRPVIQGRHDFLDADLRLLEARERPDYVFEPRGRPWFKQAQAAEPGGAVVQTAPYLFYTTREVGLTLASARGGAVAGVDVSLQALSAMLARQRITPSAELMIVDARGAVLAYPRSLPPSSAPQVGESRLVTVDELSVPVLSALWRRASSGQARAADEPLLNVADRDWVVRLEPLVTAGGPPLTLAIAAPSDELLADAIHSRNLSVLITAGMVLLMLPLVHWAANLVSRPLEQLAHEAEAIRRFDFGGPDPARSRIREVDRLALAMTGMKHTLSRFMEISSALSAERQFDTLLQRILSETISVAGATGGALHLVSADGQRLEPTGVRLRGAQGEPASLIEWQLDEPDSPSAAVQAVRQDRMVSLDLHWENPAHLARYSAIFMGLNTTSLRLVALPLKNRQNEVVGTLSLSFLPDTADHPQDLSPSRKAFIEALAGPAAVAIDNQLLLRARKELLESFIQLVAGAIDAKSPYTGAHCQRVPELTKMLARAACDASEGPFADFRLDDDAWEALHIAAWLHDCGKVTTPEFVVDKATKLETIYDRIHEVRMRFELLKREAQLARYEALLPADVLEQVRQELAPLLAQLDEEFAFIAACNEGGETMTEAQLARLREIGARTWTRTLDDRLGLSGDELKRKAGRPVAALPVQEPLLADKPEHVLPRPERERPPEANPLGFRLQVPEHLYNRGELYNLSVTRGTLTEEERYKINDHIVQTIKMLNELPLPRHLRSVPEIAGGHHEKMDGSGYPRGLTRDQMSVPARMMAVADVFEALTADDRPYKKGKLLSEALEIMAAMRREQHLDGELFELFLRSGVCRDYAQRFLHPEQIDVDELEPYLS